MRRKSQLEKFQAKLNKKAQDDEVVAKAELEGNTVENQGKKVANKYGISTEDIFMIITRDSAEAFTKLWNNSMESVLRETLRTEIKGIMREVIQEELAEAYRGIIKGMATSAVDDIDLKEIVKQELNQTVNMANDEPQKYIDNHTQQHNYNEMPSDFVDKLNQALIEAHYMGTNVTKGTEFKKLSSQHNGMYQKFSKLNKGIKGAWSDYAAKIINDLN